MEDGPSFCVPFDPGDDVSAPAIFSKHRDVRLDGRETGAGAPGPRITYDALSRQFTAAPPGKLYLLYGDPVVFRFALALASHALSRNAAIAVIDGCNRFDAHSIARFAREHGYLPDSFLNHIFVSRGFTCYQMEAAVNDRLLPFLKQAGGNIAMIFGLLDTLYDEQAPLREVRNILRRMIIRLHDMKSEGISVLLASRRWNVPDRERNALFTTLQSGMDTVCRVEMNEEMKPKFYLEQSGKALRYGTDNTDIHQYNRCGNRQLVEIPPRTAQRRPGSVR
jgi:hypothetical protein